MFTFEFDAKVRNGIIKIPDEFKKKIGSRVKVIIVSKEENEKKAVSSFNSIKLKTKEFKFDRDAANER
ncbi:MAG: hypothetical protein KGZ79_16695 [Dethiobacter sp.]|jgi:hypothetical protein|nr:hypothetical protein [Dethiobacter sp.]